MTAPFLVTAGVLLGWLTYFWAAPRVDRWRARRRERRYFSALYGQAGSVRVSDANLQSLTRHQYWHVDNVPTALVTVQRVNTDGTVDVTMSPKEDTT